MRTNLLRLLALATALAISSAAALAQGTNGIVASVPFAFSAGGTSLPAGDYRVLSTDNGITVTIQQIDGPSRATVSSFVRRLDNVPSAPKLLFHHYGERYFLSQVQNGSSETAFNIPRSKAEIKLATPEDMSPTSVVIAQKQ